ncbi:MAG: GNAT family N-acetyltransferase [Coriobacteriales bacterium]
MQGTIELHTRRLLLRRLRPDDAPVLYEHFGRDERMREFTGWNPYATEAMAEAAVEKAIDGYNAPHSYSWALEADGEFVGTIGAYDYQAAEESIEVGISIARPFWGNGYATEALTCVLGYLTEHEGIGTVTAWIASGNIGSQKAALKAGMRQVATEEDAVQVGDRLYDKLYFAYGA